MAFSLSESVTCVSSLRIKIVEDMSTIYVFGAGASRSVGYPLAAEMGKGLIDFMLQRGGYYRAMAERLIDFSSETPDIEALITDLQERIEELNDGVHITERTKLGNARGALGICLREWFREIHSRPARAYAEFASKIIQPGDSVNHI